MVERLPEPRRVAFLTTLTPSKELERRGVGRRLVRGDITINAASTDRMEAVRERITEFRDILAKDGRSKESPTRDNEE